MIKEEWRDVTLCDPAELQSHAAIVSLLVIVRDPLPCFLLLRPRDGQWAAPVSKEGRRGRR